MVKRVNKKDYLALCFAVFVFVVLNIQVYAQGGPAQGVATPAKLPNGTKYYSPTNYSSTQSKDNAQSTAANATIRSKNGTTVTSQPSYPQRAEPTIATPSISEEGQIDPNYKPADIPLPEDVQVVAQQSAMEQEERQIGSLQTNQVSIPSTASSAEERQEEIMEKEIPQNRCDKLKNVKTINYTDEQVRRYKEEMEEVCTPGPDISYEGAVELPHKTEEDTKRELSLIQKIMSFFTKEEKTVYEKFEGRKFNLSEETTATEEVINEETTAEDTKKEEDGGGGFIASFIGKIFSLFR